MRCLLTFDAHSTSKYSQYSSLLLKLNESIILQTFKFPAAVVPSDPNNKLFSWITMEKNSILKNIINH